MTAFSAEGLYDLLKGWVLEHSNFMKSQKGENKAKRLIKSNQWCRKTPRRLYVRESSWGKTMARWYCESSPLSADQASSMKREDREVHHLLQKHTQASWSIKTSKQTKTKKQSPKSMEFIMVNRVFKFLKILTLFIRREKKLSGNSWCRCIGLLLFVLDRITLNH